MNDWLIPGDSGWLEVEERDSLTMMFLYRNSVPKTAMAIQLLLDEGWELASINSDKAIFKKKNG